jgi:hypothetical protein
VLQDNPKTLNAGNSHAKRGLPIVIARSGKKVLNRTNSFNHVFAPGQECCGESVSCETEQSMRLFQSIVPPLFIIVSQAHSRTAVFSTSMAESLPVGISFTPDLSNFHLRRRAETGEIWSHRCEHGTNPSQVLLAPRSGSSLNIDKESIK